MEVEVRAWLEEYFGAQAARIDPADILGSLRLEGDDADEFLLAFAQRFGVDLQGFDPWFHYDANEPPGLRRPWVPVGRDGGRLPYLPIAIGDLAAAANARRWEMTYGGLTLGRKTLGRYVLKFLPLAVAMAVGGVLIIWLSNP